LQEYEKRLLAKDQEFKLSCEAQERMRRDIARLCHEVAHWKEQAAAIKYLPAPENGGWARCGPAWLINPTVYACGSAASIHIKRRMSQCYQTAPNQELRPLTLVAPHTCRDERGRARGV
jgi:hypothetical protein